MIEPVKGISMPADPGRPPTPALILDRADLRRNLKRMSDRLRDAGVILRPTVKTRNRCRSAAWPSKAMTGASPFSTLAEARYFAAGGFKDILYGVGIVPPSSCRRRSLRRQGVNLRVVTDNLAVARAIAAAA
jgi:D-serine deaminase-like pyridoxal phosphate-dependent protein